MGRARRRCIMLFLAVPAAILPACAAPVYVVSAGLSVAQLGTAAYANGALQSGTIVPYDDVVAAADGAAASLELRHVRRRVEPRKTVVIGQEFGGRSVSIEVVRKTPAVSKIVIRVGLFGDQAISRLVLAQMQRELEAANPDFAEEGEDGSPGGPMLFLPEDDPHGLDY